MIPSTLMFKKSHDNTETYGKDSPLGQRKENAPPKPATGVQRAFLMTIQVLALDWWGVSGLGLPSYIVGYSSPSLNQESPKAKVRSRGGREFPC